MKTLFAIALFALASSSFAAESCSFSIKDRYGYEFETHTRSSYSQSAACSDAEYACRIALSNYQARGQYYDASCERKLGRPTPNPVQARCTTDMLDIRNNVLRSFLGIGRTQQEACQDSERQCKISLAQNDSYGRRCATRSGSKPPQPPVPPRQTTESCSVGRFDPAGRYIQGYNASYTGPIGSDIKGEACRRATQICSRDIKGMQTCRVQR